MWQIQYTSEELECSYIPSPIILLDHSVGVYTQKMVEGNI